MSDLAAFLEPRGIVVVGASVTPEKIGAVMAASLRSYPGQLALVNSRGGPGMHRSIAEAVASSPSAIDLAILCVPAAGTAAALAEAASCGVRAALACSGGFAEAGGDGLEYDRLVREVVASSEIRLIGPNTSGFFLPARGLVASFAPGVTDLPAGPVAVVAASGGVNHAVSFRLAHAGVGVRIGVGLGASIDVTHVDLINHLATDEETRVVALHLESVTDGPALLAAVRRTSLVKPVVALVVGRNDVSEFAQSHTGALATSWRATRDLLQQAGAVLVDDEDQLVSAVTALAGRRLQPQESPGIGLVTAQAGPGLLIADALHSAGVDMPRLGEDTQQTLSALLPPMTYQANPVDTGRPGPDFPRVLACVTLDPRISALAIYGLTEPVIDLPQAVADSGVADAVPVIIGVDGPQPDLEAVRTAASKVPVPVTSGPTSLAHGVVALVEDARVQFQLSGGPDAPETPLLPLGSALDGPWDEIRAKDFLDSIGIRTPPRRRCQRREEAHAALAELGGPLAVKLVDPDILHKSDVGGVFLNVETSSGLDRALDALDQIGTQGYLVESMAPSGVDLIVGVRRDPVFGPIVILGIGGVTTEILADVAIRAIPMSERNAESMVDSLAAKELLFGSGSGPVLSRKELSTIMRTLGAVLVANPEIAEVEINPLRLSHDALIALDAVLILKKDDSHAHS